MVSTNETVAVPLREVTCSVFSQVAFNDSVPVFTAGNEFSRFLQSAWFA
jgi:hypothetical protein